MTDDSIMQSESHWTRGAYGRTDGPNYRSAKSAIIYRPSGTLCCLVWATASARQCRPRYFIHRAANESSDNNSPSYQTVGVDPGGSWAKYGGQGQSGHSSHQTVL